MPNYNKLNKICFIQNDRYAEVPGYDPSKHTITVFSPAKKIVSPFDFLENAVKKMVGTIRESNNVSFLIAYISSKKL